MACSVTSSLLLRQLVAVGRRGVASGVGWLGVTHRPPHAALRRWCARGDYNADVDRLWAEEVEPRFVAEGDGGGTQTFLDSTAAQLYLNRQVLRVAEVRRAHAVWAT